MCLCALLHIGLIPAWAGKTRLSSLMRIPCRAHPRVGGENALLISSRILILGSSPRGRGKLKVFRFIGTSHRLIPAWAGKTGEHARAIRQRPAHPRVGGENRSSAVGASWPSGSSPRGRGKQWDQRVPGGYRGLIPAWAGKTSPSQLATQLGWAHPRVGGENPVGAGPRRRGLGSSPRGRGKRLRYWATGRRVGLIPAWAGKTEKVK